MARHPHDETNAENVTVPDEKETLTATFNESRPRLRAVAYRMLGSMPEADDAIQETWLRVSRADASGVANLRGWLTTSVANVCLDMLRSRKARREDAVDRVPDVAFVTSTNAEDEAVLAETVGRALLVVLEKLDPVERLAFVLHDMFGVSFEEIAPIVGRNEVATRQLASRARRRVRGVQPDDDDVVRQRVAVTTLLAALRAGDVDAVVAALHPDVVVRAEGVAGVIREFRGARAWAKSAVAFARTTHAFADVTLALVDGNVGALYSPAGRASRVLRIAFDGDAIVGIDIVADEAERAAMDIATLPPEDATAPSR